IEVALEDLFEQTWLIDGEAKELGILQHVPEGTSGFPAKRGDLVRHPRPIVTAVRGAREDVSAEVRGLELRVVIAAAEPFPGREVVVPGVTDVVGLPDVVRRTSRGREVTVRSATEPGHVELRPDQDVAPCRGSRYVRSSELLRRHIGRNLDLPA